MFIFKIQKSNIFFNKCHWSIYLTFADVAQVEQEEESSPSTTAIRHPRKVSPEMDDNLEDFEMISESELAEVSPWFITRSRLFFSRLLHTYDIKFRFRKKKPLFTAWIGILFGQLYFSQSQVFFPKRYLVRRDRIFFSNSLFKCMLSCGL